MSQKDHRKKSEQKVGQSLDKEMHTGSRLCRLLEMMHKNDRREISLVVSPV